MKKVAQFEKVSLEQFKLDMKANTSFSDEEIEKIYQEIKLPKRATMGSAGYDFYLPYDVTLNVNSSVKIITGIRCRIDNGYVLQLYPRSSLGFKYRIGLDNTVGIIDADYYNANNQGHILVKISNTNFENKKVELKMKEAFCQGIFISFGITYDDEVNEVRVGGFGSTNK